MVGDVDGPFVGCCFSDDGKYLLAHTAEPDHLVVVWHWVEERPVGLMRLRTPIGRVRFNPGAASLLWTSYPLKVARLNDKGHFKGIEMPVLSKCHARADHCWLSAKVLLVADTDGTFSVIEDSILKQTTVVPDCHPTVVEKSASGFIAGCVDGKVVVFSRKAESSQYELTVTLTAASPQGG